MAALATAKKQTSNNNLLDPSMIGAVSNFDTESVINPELDTSETDEKQTKADKTRRSLRNECPRIKAMQPKGNFFNKSLHYKIHVPSLGIEIFRQYSDFEWLHKKLLERYGSTSGLFVPALPGKISLKGVNKTVIKDHCKLMQEWICDVFKHSNLYNDQSTVYFLSPHQNQNFSKMRKSYVDKQDIAKIKDEAKQDEEHSDDDDDDLNEQEMEQKRKSKRISHVQLKSNDSNPNLQAL